MAAKQLEVAVGSSDDEDETMVEEEEEEEDIEAEVCINYTSIHVL